MNRSQQHETANARGHESVDLKVRPIALFALVLLLLCLATMVVAKAFLFAHVPEQSRAPAQLPLAAPQVAPAPRLQDQPRQDMLEFRQREHRVTTEYALIDRERGIVRVPLDVALERVLERGLPTRASGGPAQETKGSKP